MAAQLTPQQLGTAPGTYNPAVPWAGPISFVNPSPLNQPYAGQSHRLAPQAIAGIAAGAAALGGGIIGAASNAKQTAETNAANRDIAREQMMFQQNMSNTAFQRARVDMERAGINPMLSGINQSSASTPQGASATMQSPRTGDDINRAISSTLSAISTAQELRTRESTIELQKAQTAASVAQAKLTDMSAYQVSEQTRKIMQEVANLRKTGKVLDADVKSKSATSKVDAAHAELNEKNAKYDNTLERINRTIGVVGSGLQLLNPFNYLRGSGRSVPPNDSGPKEIFKPNGELILRKGNTYYPDR